jgi:hypothetical protein
MAAPARLLLIGLVAAASVGTVSPTASDRAPTRVGAAGHEPFDVALAGQSAVWSTAESRYAPVAVRVASPSRPEKTILRGEEPAPGVEQLPALDAGPRMVAVSLLDFAVTERTAKVVGSSLWAGSPGGALRELNVLRRREWAASVAVSGTAIAVLAANRSDRDARPRLVVVDMSTGNARARRLSRDAQPNLAFAGRFVATALQRSDRDLTRIVVRKRRSWRPVSRTVIREDSVDIAVALRRDGTLAIAYGHPRFRAAVVAPGSRRTKLPGRPSSLAIGFGPRGVVYSQRSTRGTRLFEITPDGPIRRLTAPIRRFVAFDADRRGRIALRTESCVYVARVPALGAAPSCSR